MDLIHYYDAQVAVLGSLLIEPDKLSGEIMHRVRPEDFGDAPLRNIFRAAKELYLANAPLDAVTVVERAGKGYEPLVRQILEATPTAQNWEAYVTLLKDGAQMAFLRRLGEQLQDAKDMEQCRKLLASAEGMLTARPGRKASTYQELISDYLDRQSDKSPPDYLDWGIEQLNRNISVSPGRFVILGADSSVGKTALALQLAYNIAAKGKRVGFFSYETSRADAGDRIMANTANINLPRSKHKELSEEDYIKATAEGDRSVKIRFTLVETSGYTVDELRTETLAGRYDVIFIDYVQLIPAKASDRWQVVTEVSMALHTMAQQLGVTVIALSQVTPPELDKKGKRRPLRKGDLRESRQLINDADLILMMDLVDPDDSQSLRVLRIDKNKDGPLGKIYLSFDAEHMRFTSAPAPPSEAYQKVMDAVAKAKKEQREEARKKKGQPIDGQAKFEELPDNGEPPPF